jgi:hypothetical protein
MAYASLAAMATISADSGINSKGQWNEGLSGVKCCRVSGLYSLPLIKITKAPL